MTEFNMGKQQMNTQIIQDNIQKKIDEYYEQFQMRMKEVEEPEVIEFVEKYIDWYNNNPMSCYEMFREVISQDRLSFFGDLESFIVNYFYDDSYFTIKWFRRKRNENGQLVEIECDKDSSVWAQPRVVWDNDNGTQDPKVLLKAMAEKEEQERKQKEFFESLKSLPARTQEVIQNENQVS